VLGATGLAAVMATGAIVAAGLHSDSIDSPVVVLLDGQHEYPLGQHVEYLEDHAQVLTFEQVSAPAFDSRFRRSQAEFQNFGFKNSAFWVRFTVRNESSASTQWLLELAEPAMNSVELYMPVESGFEVVRTGYIYPFESRDVPDETFVFRLPVAPGAQETYYLRLQDKLVSLPLRIWSRDAFEGRRQLTQLLSGLSFGALAIMLVYNLFLALTLRDRGYFYYFFFQASLLLYLAGVRGYGPRYLWPEVTWFSPFIISLLLELILISLLLFSGEFLKIETHAPRLRPVHGALLGFLALAIVPTPLIGSDILIVIIPTAFVVLAFTSVLGVLVLRRGFRPAAYFLLSWAPFFAIGLALILGRASILPAGSLVSDQVLQVGAVFAVGVQSLALADRINLYRSAASRSRDLSDVNAKLAQMIAERILAQEQLEILARTDPLCGLYNRRHFFALGEAAFKKAVRYRQPLSVILFDIDHFKSINDTHGHKAGDQALIHIAELTRQTAREADIIARHGGDEFILLLPETDAASALQAAERLRMQVESASLLADGRALNCTITLGVAGIDRGVSGNFDQLLIWADQALYQAKQSGRNRVWLFQKPDATPVHTPG
jgi:diguanylate cyclase (GGDEF)-like protein